MKILQIRGARAERSPVTVPTPEEAQRGRFAPLDSKLFCKLPFSAVNIMEDGNVYPDCCPDWVQFPLGNVLTQSWDEVWNGENARRLRRSMHRGDLRHCDRHWCPHIQNALNGIDDDNVVPRRDRRRLELPADALAGSDEMSSGPVRVGMHYDDSCNLACPTCRGEIHMVHGEAFEQMARMHAVVVDEILPTASSISLTGTGDPFASSFLREFLVAFDRERFPNLERIHLHTNAIMWTPGLWARMSALHDIDVTTDISIDAARPETYEVVRRPARWGRLRENLDFITTIPNVSTIGVSMTVSQLNYTELCEFHRFATELSERCPDKFFFVEYKRVRRRPHHDDAEWRGLALEYLGDRDTVVLLDQLRVLEELRSSGPARPDIRSNLGEFMELQRA